jgi:hypothetical protein
VRRSKFLISFLLGFLAFTLAGRARADGAYSFTTLPNPGPVSGLPGDTIGWGYSITNSSTTDYLVTLDVNEDSVLDSLGTVTAIFDLPIVAPISTVNESYDPVNMFGLIEVTLNPNLAPGTIATGSVYMDAEFCDVTLTICSDVVTESAAYSLTVGSSPSTGVPEPSSMLMLLSGLCGIGIWLAHRQRYSGRRAAQ